MVPRHNGCIYDSLMDRHRSEARPTLFLPLLSILLEPAGPQRRRCFCLNHLPLLVTLGSIDLGVVRQLVLPQMNHTLTFHFPTPDRAVQTCT